METLNDRINWLNERTKEYNEGHPTVSDKEWDDKFFELKGVENNSNSFFINSPTQSVDPTFDPEVVSELKKVEHNHQMLSLDKTKDLFEVLAFLNNHDYIAMAKLDGLTLTLKYDKGKLISAETRGNGIVGEDVTHNARVIKNIPQEIGYDEELIVDGEVISTYTNFEQFSGWFKNPRNFAAGSIRLLDANECATRGLSFIVWEVIKGFDESVLLSNKLDIMEKLGFTVVPYSFNEDINTVVDTIREISSLNSYPIDGVVFKFNSIEYGKSLGQTSHHFKNAIAYKFYDEIISSKLTGIDWTMGRTGILTPVAEFKPVEMDGSTVSRASLHNVSVIEELIGRPFVGQEVQVYKANMIIPQIHKAKGPRVGVDEEWIEIPDICPICGEKTDLIIRDGVKELYCSNPNCAGKFINQVDHFVGKKGLDVKGLSKATIEKLLDWGWIETFSDIFKLENHKLEWGKKPGFGQKSVSNILNSIEEAKNTTLEKFISSLGIPLIGSTVSKEICKHVDDYEDFRNKCLTHFDFSKWDGFAESKTQSLWNFDFTEANKIYEYLNIVQEEKEDVSLTLNGKTIVITGRLTEFKNRNELQKAIEERGGKVVGSISKRTDYLINNDIFSESTKNKSAKQYGIPIVTESDFKAQFID